MLVKTGACASLDRKYSDFPLTSAGVPDHDFVLPVQPTGAGELSGPDQ